MSHQQHESADGTYMNLKEAARYLKMSSSTMYKHTSAGRLPFCKPFGKLIVFNKAQLDKWIADRSNSSDRK
jgi:excisionase family DNA binding protein